MTNIHMLLLLVVIAITSIYAYNNRRIITKLQCVVFVSIVLTFFSGLRSWWMGDLIKYYTLFRKCNGYNWKEEVFGSYSNVGIRIFFKLIGSLGWPYEYCIFIIALFSATALGIVIYSFSSSPFWSYLIYISMGFYLFTYSGLKQTIAMSFIMLAYKEIVNKRLIRYFVFVSLATIFHMPALVFLPAFFLARKKIDKTYITVLIGSVFSLFIFRNQIVKIALDAYYETEHTFEASGLVGGRVLMIILILFVGIILRPHRTEDEEWGIVYNIIVMAAMVQIFSVYNNIFTRLADYYFQFICLFFAYMLQRSGTNQNSNVQKNIYISRFSTQILMNLGLCIIIFAIFYYNNYLKNNIWLLENYKFVWEVDPYSLYGH